MEDHGGSPELFLFLASTVHDMKNSISVLSGTLENLLASAPGAPAVADTSYPQMAHMLYQTRRLNDKLIQLLALYKEVGKPSYPYDPNAVRIEELVQQLAAQQRILLNSKSIRFDAEYVPDLIWTFDEDLVIGVLLHAINNAIRYTTDRIRLSIAAQDGWLELRVEDNGIGFPPAMLQAGAALNGGAPVDFASNSTGLGLYFSSEVAKMHRHRGRAGSVHLENGGRLGGGVFILRLP
ncbi:HAMP domain-containing histidine kinase [Massilia sp. MB5]|uniref:sensor histidine kinase n=1 Tax=Massilia sp. MB5 TaxID=2919578 RepID=UPI001F0F3D58|nr:HAMP domain-containing sensor histidine kinase [Massilia sp. MB5]UMR32449.1 HAMP domain-containing histidine kinase [Massilia sp. MB5]